MPKVILQPAAGPEAREHYRNTVVRTRSLTELRPVLTSSEYKALAALYPDGETRIWGSTSGRNRPYLERMTPGDLVLFYLDDRRFQNLLTLVYKTHNKQLAKHLWGTEVTERGETRTWEYVFFLDSPREIDIPYKTLRAVADYGPAESLPWLEVLSPDKSADVISHFKLQLPDLQQQYAEITRDIDSLGELDQRRESVVRKEQAFLRAHLFGRSANGNCGICGREFPVDLLVAAHVKRRADCSDEEKRDYRHNVIPMCKFGCDDLFERGYLAVQDGKVRAGRTTSPVKTVRDYVTWCQGKACQYWSAESAQYFNWHSAHAGA